MKLRQSLNHFSKQKIAMEKIFVDVDTDGGKCYSLTLNGIEYHPSTYSDRYIYGYRID